MAAVKLAVQLVIMAAWSDDRQGIDARKALELKVGLTVT